MSNLERLEEICTIQCSKGNWDYDPYMHGLANGLIMALAILKDEEPCYLSSPAVWGKDQAKIMSLESGEK